MAGHGHSHGHCEHEAQEQPSDLGVAYSLYTKIDTENVQCLNEAVEGSGKKIFKPWEKRLDVNEFVESDVDEELLFNIPFTGIVKLKGIIVVGGEDDTHPSKMKLFKNRPNINFDDVNTEPDEEFEMQPDTTGTLEYPINLGLDGLLAPMPEIGKHRLVVKSGTKICKAINIKLSEPNPVVIGAHRYNPSYFEKKSEIIIQKELVVKFPNVHHLTIYFPKNFGAESTKVYYIGLKGEFTKLPRQEITICTYESAPNPCDHKTKVYDPMSYEIR